MRAVLFLGICLAFLTMAQASGATWHVDDSVTSSGDGTSWATAFKRIQEGIDASTEDDTVIVAQGAYLENIHFGGKNIILMSTDPLDPAVVANTIIDGNQVGSVVTFSGTETEACVLSGFTIYNGSSSLGGGIRAGTAGNHSDTTIENNSITGNSATHGAGVIYCDGLIRNNTITGNSAEGNGGGVGECSGEIHDNTITGNSAGWNGGALSGGQGLIRNNTIASNTAQLTGGGLYACGGTIQNNGIADNRAAQNGGGLQTCPGTIQNNTITGNWAGDSGGGLIGCGGIIQNNSITGNVAGRSGGGLQGCGGTIQNNTITGNSAQDDGGGLIGCGGIIQNNSITGNVAGRSGGGLQGCDGTIQNNAIAGNSSEWGGGLYACDASIRNNTIVHNSATQNGGGLSYCVGTIRNCILWENTAGNGPQLDGSSVPAYSCIEGWTEGGEGNISEDPQFIDPDGPDNDPETQEDNNYRLSGASPCIDAGTNETWMESATDLDGNPRIVDGDADGQANVDMGAYEYSFKFLVTHILQETEGTLRLTWASGQAASYVVWSCTDLTAGQWTDEAGLPSQGESTTWTDTSPAASHKFYRIEQF